MASTLTVADRTRAIIAKNLGVETGKVTDDARLGCDLNADSLDMIELAMTIEEELDVALPEDCEADWRTVGDVIASVGGVRS